MTTEELNLDGSDNQNARDSSSTSNNSSNHHNMTTKTEEKDQTPSFLTWRSKDEPEYENFSDWTIIVTVKNPREKDDEGLAHEPHHHHHHNIISNNTTTTYFVHKAVVAVGIRSSHYFRRLFTMGKNNCGPKDDDDDDDEKEETPPATSRFELQPTAARAFPAMLDFMYGPATHEPNHHLQATTESAVALRYLAEFFGIPALFAEVNHFIQRDMDKDNVEIYLKEAKSYQDDAIIDKTINVAEKSIRYDLLECGNTMPEEQSLYMKLLPDVKRGDLCYELLLQTVAELHRTRDELEQSNAVAVSTPRRKKPRTGTPSSASTTPSPVPQTPTRLHLSLPKVFNPFSK